MIIDTSTQSNVEINAIIDLIEYRHKRDICKYMQSYVL